MQVYAHSTGLAIALAEMYPSLHFIVQLCTPSSKNEAGDTCKTEDLNRRITVQKRVPGAIQTVKDAAVYILQLSSPSHSLASRVASELQAHLTVLSKNSMATLILAPRLLPEPGSVDPDVEAVARMRDLSRLQLTNEYEIELSELIEMVNSVHDSRGRLVVVNKLRSSNNVTVALGVKYQPYTDGLDIAEPVAI